MKFKRQHGLGVALVITLVLSAHVALQDRSERQIVEPASRAVAAREIAGRTEGQSRPLSTDERDPLVDPATDPFKVVNFSAPVQVAPAPPPPAPVVESKPVAPPFPYRFFGQMVGVDGKTLTFLSRDNALVPIKVGSVLDEVYRIDAMSGKQISLTYLPLNEQISIPMQSAAE